MTQRPWSRSERLAICVVCMTWSFQISGNAQQAGRRVATLELLATHTSFFHSQEIIVHADAIGEKVLTYLIDDDGNSLLVLDVSPPPHGTRNRLEVVGIFYDIGRLEPNDPRTVGLPFERLSSSLLGHPWPRIGELPVLVASSSRVVREDSEVTLRKIALVPERYVDQSVTITGRFRGRNLYGDLPQSPGVNPWDFVLVSADAAVWVIGKKPEGKGFKLDVQARFDTGRWLKVTGKVRFEEGMVLVEAGAIALAEKPKTTDEPAHPVETRLGPTPNVILSVPLQDDTEVLSDTTVRIQFSRDMDPDSFKGQVRINYPPIESLGVATRESTAIDFNVEYHARNRVLEIQFDQKLERLRSLRVELLEGITASDGVPLQGWTLSFFVGS